MGLSFSVPPGSPSTLPGQYIQRNLNQTWAWNPSGVGDLTPWAKQGVLLLNAALTVRAGEPFSHAKIGWADFTDAVIRHISDHKVNVVFILWGKFAQEKQVLIDETKHHVLKAAHLRLSPPIKASLAAAIFLKNKSVTGS